MLQARGSKLAELTLMRCNGLSNRTTILDIVRCCSALEELTLIQTTTIADLLHKLILPDHLKMLRKLTVDETTYKAVRSQQNRLSNIVHSICADSQLTPVAKCFV